MEEEEPCEDRAPVEGVEELFDSIVGVRLGSVDSRLLPSRKYSEINKRIKIIIETRDNISETHNLGSWGQRKEKS